MSSPDLTQEASRQFTVCNACRYCEGYCAVFPAMEARRLFTEGDVAYIASLCHDCRDCYYACQYVPPHEFAINIPALLGEVRTETYGRGAWPAGDAARRGSSRSYLALSAILLALGLLALLGTAGTASFFTAHQGPGAFYALVPEWLLDAIFLLLGLYWLVAWIVSGRLFWRTTSGASHVRPVWPDVAGALTDALSLRYLGGGAAGCDYPAETPSGLRRVFHHLVAYGFLADLGATALAAIYDHLLHIPAPYPMTSPVVLLGSIGGAGIVAGSCGLLYLKGQSDRDVETARPRGMDTAFLLALVLVSVTGFLVLAFRATALLGLFLTLHLASVAALFLTAPYGKFAHLVYRFVSLLRFRGEVRLLDAAGQEAQDTSSPEVSAASVIETPR